MDELTMADVLLGRKPVMPEEYDRHSDADMFMPHLRALGAGIVDPMGLTGMGLRAAGYEHPARKLHEWRAESPVAAGMGSAILPGLGLGKLGGATIREMLAPVPLFPAMGIGGHLGNIAASDWGVPRPSPRAQGSYPTGGAY